MSLRDRLAPAIYDLMGGPIEKQPLIAANRRKLRPHVLGRAVRQ